MSPFLSRDKQSALQYVKDYKPLIEGRQIRILLHGPVGAGKSSFINSIKSVLKGRICTVTAVDNTYCDGFTKNVRSKFDCVKQLRKPHKCSMSYKKHFKP